MKFDLPKDQSSIIKVIGVGGGGSNAVNHMYEQGIKGVDFIVCNTDQQALDISPVPLKIALGSSLTEGRGAGSIPEVGRNAAIENIDELREILSKNTKMVFITAGMGGGTGTGAAPVIAQTAKEAGLLTVGIVTMPFTFEGKKRRMQAESGIEEMKKHVDTLLVINNEKLREIYGNLKLAEAFGHADDVLSNAAKSIAEIISVTLHINVDFEDVNTVMKDSGVAILGSAEAEGEGRAVKAVDLALSSPLLNDNNIQGARYVLLNVRSGSNEITMDELGEITDYIQEAAGQTAEIITGYGSDETLGEKVSVTIVATGFKSKGIDASLNFTKPEKIVRKLTEETPAVKPTIIEPKEIPTPPPVEDKVEEEEDVPEEPFLITREVEESKEQVSFEFDLKKENPEPTPVEEEPKMETEEPTIIRRELSPEPPKVETPAPKPMDSDQQLRKAQDRISKLKELNMKLKTSSGISELEKEPAYRRRNVSLDSTPHSSESQVSKYTLSKDENNDETNIKPNNSFLHDNVD